jgi:hypothetical protein
MQIPSVVKATFLLPLGVKKKTAGKNSQPFQQEDFGATATKLFSAFQPALLKLED